MQRRISVLIFSSMIFVACGESGRPHISSQGYGTASSAAQMVHLLGTPPTVDEVRHRQQFHASILSDRWDLIDKDGHRDDSGISIRFDTFSTDPYIDSGYVFSLTQVEPETSRGLLLMNGRTHRQHPTLDQPNTVRGFATYPMSMAKMKAQLDNTESGLTLTIAWRSYDDYLVQFDDRMVFQKASVVAKRDPQ